MEVFLTSLLLEIGKQASKIYMIFVNHYFQLVPSCHQCSTSNCIITANEQEALGHLKMNHEYYPLSWTIRRLQIPGSHHTKTKSMSLTKWRLIMCTALPPSEDDLENCFTLAFSTHPQSGVFPSLNVVS